MDVSTTDKGLFGFGPFRLDPARRRLWRDGMPMRLPARQFDTLLYLVENAGRVVEKDELFAAVWGERITEDGSLKQTIFLLRRALQAEDGEDYIVTAPGRGYRFVAVVNRSAAGAAAAEDGQPAAARAPLFQQTTAFGQTLSDDVTGAPSHVTASPERAGAMRLLRRRWGYIVASIVGVAMLATTGLVRRQGGPDSPPFDPPPHSVAVLAFTNLSGDPKKEYFSEGLSEELINTLSRIDGLQVAARVSAFSFNGTHATAGDIARKLNVGAILEGSVRGDGARLRVTAQLVNAVTGFQFWSHSYDRDKSDILKLETEIADAVAQSLEVTLLGYEKTNLTEGGTNNPLAFDAYLRGSGLIRFYDEKSVRAALPAFDEAIRLDPNFADARALRALALWAMGFVWGDDPRPRDDELNEAVAEARRALKFAPNSARAHGILGQLLATRLDMRGAEAEVLRAHALNDGDVIVERNYAFVEANLGHPEEAERAARRMVQLDPLNAGEYYFLAIYLSNARQYDEALDALRREKALGIVNPWGTAWIAAYAHLGQGNAKAALLDCEHICDDDDLIVPLADIRLGRAAKAHAALEKLRAKSGDGGWNTYAAIYAQWGDREAALHWLEIGYKLHDAVSLSAIKRGWTLDPIRDTPQYKELIRKLDFPP